MYECGFARSRGIRLIVLQCAEEAPAPFLDKVRTRATDESDLYKFTKDFMTSGDFFPNQKEKVTEYAETDPAVTEKASTLHKALNATIKEVIGQEPQEWSAWPSLNLKLDGAAINEIKTSAPGARVKAVSTHLRKSATVVDSKGADRVFGVGIDDGVTFLSVMEAWQTSYPRVDLEWFDTICEQVEAFIRRGFPSLRDARIAEVMGRNSLVPIVVRQLTFPQEQAIEFQIAFYDIQPKSPKVTDVMVLKKDMYCHELAPDGSSNEELREVYNVMKQRNITRLPILDSNGKLEFMVHRSIISEFLLESSADAPTLNDLLHAPMLHQMLQSTFVFVSPSDTLDDARKQLKTVEGARDVFVTDQGERGRPVLGMLANTDLDSRDN